MIGSLMQERLNRRRSLVNVLLLLILVLVAGGTLGCSGSAPTTQANGNVTATAQARNNPTVGAQTNGSPAGKTWHVQVSGTSQWLEDVVWSGSQFVVVGGWGDTILTSPDGDSWTTQNFGPSNYQYLFSGVVWSGSHLVVVGDAGTILTSL